MKNKVFNWVIIVVGLILIVNITRSILDLSGKSKIVEEAESRLREVQTKNANLREEYRDVKRDDYIERVARDKLGMSKEEEVVVVIPDEKVGSEKFRSKADQPGAGEAGSGENELQGKMNFWDELFSLIF